jgi:hypothetical protein
VNEVLELGKTSRRSYVSDGKGLNNGACYAEIMLILIDETRHVDLL